MSANRTSQLRAIVDNATAALEGATAEEVLMWTAHTFGEKWVLASSMQDAVLIDVAVRIKPDVGVIFLDTGYHFAETIGIRDALPLVYPELKMFNVTPDWSVAEQDAVEGAELYARDPDRCCALRKVEPLVGILGKYDAWVTGVRRADSPGRRDVPIVSWDERNRLVKVNPIAAWGDVQFNEYIVNNGVLQNLLVADGYPSIGCEPCTTRPRIIGDARSGRWIGTGKTECGLHE